jgi:hypothetical protein
VRFRHDLGPRRQRLVEGRQELLDFRKLLQSKTVGEKYPEVTIIIFGGLANFWAKILKVVLTVFGDFANLLRKKFEGCLDHLT